jgi:hypothetical protein
MRAEYSDPGGRGFPSECRQEIHVITVVGISALPETVIRLDRLEDYLGPWDLLG